MYKQKVNEGDLKDLFSAILTLETREDCQDFFDDLCTIDEIKSLAQRWQVAQMLQDKATYSDIMSETGASSTTISRVKKSLEYGTGYARVLKKRKSI